MPRDINGVYTLPAGNPVVPGTVISTNWANTTLTDIAAALTASITQTAADARYLRLTGGTLTGGLTIPSLNGGQLAGMRNKIINGKMEIAQRGISVSLTASGQFSLDRWRHTWDGSGATRVVSRQEFIVGTGPETIKNFLSYVQGGAGSGGTFNSMEQLIEGVDNFAGQTVTLSFYARNNAATPLPRILCRQFFGTGGSAGVDTTVATNVATTASFTRYTYTFVVPSIVGKTVAGGNDYIGILILLPVNSVFTFDITGVQLEVGSVATPFEHRPYGAELALCQRYFQRHDYTIGGGQSYAGQLLYFPLTLPVAMRVSPTGQVSGTSLSGAMNGHPTLGATTTDAVLTSNNFSALNSNGSAIGTFTVSAEL